MTTNTKITPSSPRLATLLSDVERGNIKIPVFQRKFIWTDEQIISLLDSVYKGYPVGSLLLWETKEALKHERNVGGFKLPENRENYPVNYVLDGQQRLTTLFGVFHSDQNAEDPEMAERFKICYVPCEDTFMHQSETGNKKNILMRDILNTTKLLNQLAIFPDEDRQKITNIVERFKDYEFPIVTIKERTNQEVCSIFQRINSSGTPLSNLELLSAWTWSDRFDLRKEIESLLDKLKDKGYERIDESLFLRCLSTIALDSSNSDDLIRINPDELTRLVKKLQKSIFCSIDFLEGQLKIKNIVFLPFSLMIIPLTYFYSKQPKANSEQIIQLKKWFWHCAFSQKYAAGTNRMLLADIKNMKNLAKGEYPFNFSEYQVDKGIFRQPWRINTTVAKATICLLAQKIPLSFLNGQEINLGKTLSEYNAREFHHIYPKSFLAKLGIDFHAANVIANICFLSSNDNKSITDKSPVDYFREIPRELKNKVFDASLIPEKARDGKLNYEDFIRERILELANLATKLIKYGRL